jgi:2OG-Fe(II) oxygenase superfamily
MNLNYKDFIGVYSNLYPDGYCKHLINEFERLANSGAGSNRRQSENALAHYKNDYQMMMHINRHNLMPFENKESVDIFFKGLQSCYEQYTDKFSILKSDKIVCTTMKMQRTDPGGGYHVWHGEQGSGQHGSRVIVYSLYLNTLEPEFAGETEFLYQQERFRPIENTMILWPASYTHAHRGNTVFGNTSKYIVTGWFYYD